MKVDAIRTSIVQPNQPLVDFITEHVPSLEDKSVLVISSKIVALCEGRVVNGSTDMQELVRQEADQYLAKSFSDTGYTFTIKRRTLSGAAGIDRSNADGDYVLWPADPQATANELWQTLRQHYKIQQLGIIISDSTSFPMRRGTVGISIGHCGLVAVNSYIGQPDLHGRPLSVSQRGTVTGLVAAANVVMGEGSEQTPLATITDVDFVQFQDRPPTLSELDEYYLTLEDDLYAPLFKAAPWQTDD